MSDNNRDRMKSGIDKAADTAKSTTDWVAEKAGEVKEGAVGLVDAVQDRAKTMANSFATQANRAGHKAGEFIADAVEPIEEFVEQKYECSKNAMEAFGRDASGMIRRYPLTALAIGLGAGILLGRAMSSSRA